MRPPYNHVPRYLPSYAAAHVGISVTCSAGGVDTPKIAKNTRRCPPCQAVHEREYRRQYRRQWREKA